MNRRVWKLYMVVLLPTLFGNTFCMEQQTITYTYEEHSVVVDFSLPEGATRPRASSQDSAQQTSPQGNKVQDVTDLCKVVAVQPGEEALPGADTRVPARVQTSLIAAPALDNPLNLPPTTIAALKADLTQELAVAAVADPKTPEEIAAQDARCKKIKMMMIILGVTVAGSAVTAGFAYLGVSLQ